MTSVAPGVCLQVGLVWCVWRQFGDWGRCVAAWGVRAYLTTRTEKERENILK